MKSKIRKNSVFIANFIVLFLILVTYLSIQINEIEFYRQMAYDEAIKDAELTARDINDSLNGFVIEQRVVSQMMSNDMFLKEWCHSETGETAGQNVYSLYSYLREYKNIYGYDVVFFISDSTKNYYYDGGFNKTLDENDDFDSWYFNFLTLHQPYDMQVDHDEVNDNQVSLFVNCLVQDKGFQTLGVVGVGNNMNSFQRQVAEYEKEYGVEISVVNIGNAHNSFKGSTGYYKTAEQVAEQFGVSEEELCQNVGDEGLSLTKDNRCISIQHNNELNWNIIVQKDITNRINSIMDRVIKRFGIVALFIVVYMAFSVTLMRKLNRLNRKAENTDDLTGLLNNKIFSENFERERKKKNHKQMTVSLFMLDVDDFKIFNDTYGHLYGNTVLKIVADGLKETVENTGVVARWGGDEFIGVYFGSPEETLEKLNSLLEEIKGIETNKTITCSCGIAQVDLSENLEKNMGRADKALYTSKENGKGQCTIYEKK
ncbi:diguanylate cyclase (GGDEF) domain-containing protein [Pseudobutyrivibrio sp. YE44]|uniref:sensor domain-containing diguanylate cyclase n=1 Tax=Pseudobutyrivibrio sp. YE44 TaxID=1520802 RepID=UPI0008809E02|nr:diguanylate cyclase [Pseudobutyrivibrio sp. YE44]SDB04498.1 diguanylate cyclase (GGDEF) domain-containing protein [Pseudobutyrivibrio sp. YE44]